MEIGRWLKTLARLTHPRLHRFRTVLQISAFQLLRVRGLRTPLMFLISAIDADEGSELSPAQRVSGIVASPFLLRQNYRGLALLSLRSYG